MTLLLHRRVTALALFAGTLVASFAPAVRADVGAPEEVAKLYHAGHYNQAVEVLQAAVGKYPQDSTLHYWLGRNFFELRDFSTRSATGDGYALEAASPEGERLVWNGTVRLAPLASRGVFEVADLKARTVWNYLRDSLPFEIAAGTIGLKGDYELGGAPGPMSLAVNVHNTTVTGLGSTPAV